MPIVNGVYQPWVTNTINASQGFTGIITAIKINIPWFFAFLLIIVYIMLLVIYRTDPRGRKKYIIITRNGMITAMLFALFGLVDVLVVGSSVGVFLLTTLIVVAGGD